MMTSQPEVITQSGVLVIDKPAGWTSHQVVGRIRKLAGTRKVGHAGTLDPMATGVLVIGIGKATRLLGHLALTEKAYDATIRLGVSTVTDDADGEVTATAGAYGVTDYQIEAALAALRGEVMQVPSAVSAIKIDGVRSYAKVRSGQDVALPPRPVTVDRLEVAGRRDVQADGIAIIDLDVPRRVFVGYICSGACPRPGKHSRNGWSLNRAAPDARGTIQPEQAQTSAPGRTRTQDRATGGRGPDQLRDADCHRHASKLHPKRSTVG